MGVIEMVKKYAVELELNDVRKRKAIQNKLGFNIDNAIAINIETNETVSNDEAPTRRVAAPAVAETTSAPARRYNVSQK
jgi:hypothetical protein